MIVNAAVREILQCKIGDELVVANQQEYFNDAPVDEYGNIQLYKEVVDIVRDKDKIIILTR